MKQRRQSQNFKTLIKHHNANRQLISAVIDRSYSRCSNCCFLLGHRFGDVSCVRGECLQLQSNVTKLRRRVRACVSKRIAVKACTKRQTQLNWNMSVQFSLFLSFCARQNKNTKAVV